MLCAVYEWKLFIHVCKWCIDAEGKTPHHTCKPTLLPWNLLHYTARIHLMGKIGTVRNATKKVAWRTSWGWNVCCGYKLDVLPLLISLIKAPDLEIVCHFLGTTHTLFSRKKAVPRTSLAKQRQMAWRGHAEVWKPLDNPHPTFLKG